jgi:hypothetical protein
MAAHDRIRLTGQLRKSPAPAGLFHAGDREARGVRSNQRACRLSMRVKLSVQRMVATDLLP